MEDRRDRVTGGECGGSVLIVEVRGRRRVVVGVWLPDAENVSLIRAAPGDHDVLTFIGTLLAPRAHAACASVVTGGGGTGQGRIERDAGAAHRDRDQRRTCRVDHGENDGEHEVNECLIRMAYKCSIRVSVGLHSYAPRSGGCASYETRIMVLLSELYCRPDPIAAIT